jgi:hypothetical protein
MASGGGAAPMAGAGGSGAGTTVTPAKPGAHTRTEFVILFIWKEPTPSDALRGEGDTPK